MTTTVGQPPLAPAPPAPGPPATDDLGPFTPERPRAPWGNRVLATLLDSAVVASVAFLATGDAPSLAAVPGPGETADAGGAGWTAGTLLVLGVLQAYTGATPGKRVAGISVVDAASGRPIGLLGTVLRWLAHLLDAILLIGYLRAAVHREGRTFADSLLGTVAVRTTRPEPHPWVAHARRSRDTHAPWLRWPPRVTGAVALVLCAASAAMSLVQGSAGGITTAESESSCEVPGTSPYIALIGSSSSERNESRAGIWRTTEKSWQAVVGWSIATAGTDPDARMPLDARAGLTVHSPDGRQYTPRGEPTAPDGADDTWWSMPGDDVASAVVDADEDLSGWTVTSTLVDGAGKVLAECVGAVPLLDPDTAPWGPGTGPS